MAVGHRRTLGARIGAILGVVCGLIALLAGLTDHAWKFGVSGWFAGGGLLVDGALASQGIRESAARR